jgi:uncharacterized protein (TIGR02268 family)
MLALLSLVAWRAAAQPSSEPTVRVRRVSLTGTPVDVRVAPGIPTTLNFDADIDPRTVEVAAPGRVTLLDKGVKSITLTPVAALRDAVALRVRFADPALTLEPVFSLRTDPKEVDAQVTAYRDARAPELLRAQVAELEARCAACEAQLAALRERTPPTGPAALVLSGVLGESGVSVNLANHCETGPGAGGVACHDARRFRAEKWVVVAMGVQNAPGGPEWKPGGAWLVNDASGERFAARVVAMAPAVLAPGTAGRVVVEFAKPPDSLGKVVRMEVQEAAGARHLSISGVTWEKAAKPAEKRQAP